MVPLAGAALLSVFLGYQAAFCEAGALGFTVLVWLELAPLVASTMATAVDGALAAIEGGSCFTDNV